MQDLLAVSFHQSLHLLHQQLTQLDPLPTCFILEYNLLVTQHNTPAFPVSMQDLLADNTSAFPVSMQDLLAVPIHQSLHLLNQQLTQLDTLPICFILEYNLPITQHNTPAFPVSMQDFVRRENAAD
ncbi:hypothetical protein M8J75_014406 [Diaphorina citri]|nr:hypothetical protein M8J75_014406 [Diaphorina citri]KAI5701888.1 hypothetical protein M8J75_014406 [Diaphorina citri]KAI5734181.1 hypothetical protein M8J77_003537 [Diaphorina citri]